MINIYLLQINKGATVDKYLRSGYVSTHFLASQEYSWTSHVLRFPQPTQWYSLAHVFLFAWISKIALVHLCSNGSR